MSHGITEIDKGYVNANSTWHGLPNYVCIPERPINILEAIEVADYPLEKRRLWFCTSHDEQGIEEKTDIDLLDYEQVGDAYSIVRTDFEPPRVVVPMVGARFSVEENTRMVHFLNEHLLAEFPDLVIESVGTLFGGATFFINLKVGEFTVRGDSSKTLTNLMYANPLGRGSHTACAHSTRIVCNNTAQIAQSQGYANQSLKKFRHTSSATERINEHLIDMAKFKLGLEQYEYQMNQLADTPIPSAGFLDDFLNTTFGNPHEVKGRSQTMITNNVEAYKNVLRKQRPTLTDKAGNSLYALFQGYTDWVDHEKQSRGSDSAAVQWDGLMGQRQKDKAGVLDSLLAAV
jgi:phage/plasmid-like protein (TIGR03299 family)